MVSPLGCRLTLKPSHCPRVSTLADDGSKDPKQEQHLNNTTHNTMSSRIHIVSHSRDHTHVPVLEAIKINSKQSFAFYATEKEGYGVESFIKHDSIKKVELNKDEIKKLKKLLKITTWALTRVLGKNSEEEWHSEKYTGRQYFTIKGKYEKWYCHRLGPEGQGRQFDSKWREIELILTGAIWRSRGLDVEI